MPKHRHKPTRKYMKKAAMVGGVAATATALTMGLTAPSAGASTLPGLGTVPGTEGIELGPDVDLAELSPTEILNLGSLLRLGDLDLGELLGLNLGGINNVTDLLEPLGINLVTTGPPFGLLALFGVNLGYVPAFPPAIVDEVTSTEPALNLGQLLALLDPALGGLLEGLADFGSITLPGVRIPIVIGFGIGSLATGLAYPEIRDHFTSEEERGVLTILPVILLRNWGRADGGIAARFAPLLDPVVRLFGYDSVVTPDVQNDADYFQPLPFIPGIPTGGLIPIKVDATWEYDPFSDFPVWPNPVSLANAVAAGLFPTYILRGGDLAATLTQFPALGGILGEVLDPEGALNIFLTVPSDRQPILEPFRYPFDVANFFTGGAFNFTNPFADAVEPAIKILGNLGYTNVVQNPEEGSPLDPYDRDFSNNYGQESAPFFTFPENVDWGQVPEDVFNALVQGVTDAFFFGGIPGVNNPPDGIYRNPIDVIGELTSLMENLPTLLPNLPDLPTARLTTFVPPQADQAQLRNGPMQLTMNLDGSTGEPQKAEQPGPIDEDMLDARSEHSGSGFGSRRGSHPDLLRNGRQAVGQTSEGIRDAGDHLRNGAEDGVDRITDTRDQIRKTISGGRTNRQQAVNDESAKNTGAKQTVKKEQDQGDE